ncbi:Cysteine-rich CPXCG [Microbulbifer donghaiensis]|uniref:Cysteine-rich CPXCG n=1 Tax=Microbulbifer donghaiensis TaxID=494016 RepID=A0A1M5FG58_9GAMM|nr:CPXCG motif-containing cysteine-rich protein [Microbulbifer donghaiensis]SHF90475.1 Cysteine-rich CPXCG [Microbulbifer donghaiensis]
MDYLEECSAPCPYCGEVITLLVDFSAGTQTYIEDCSVCCRPIVIRLTENADGSLDVRLQHENET